MRRGNGGTFQPPPGSLVDTQHPRGRGCVGAWYASATEHGLYWEDISGQRNHGTLTGMDPTTDWAEGKDGWGLDFDGSNDYVDLGTRVYVRTDAPWTVLVRCNRTGYTSAAAGNYPILFESKANQSENWRVGFSDNNSYDNLYFGAASGFAKLKFAAGLATATWYDVLISYNGAGATTTGNYAAYINGVSQSIASASVFVSRTGNSTICSASAAQQFQGVVDAVLAYNCALDAEDAERIYYEPYAHIWVPGRRSTWWSSAAAAASSIPAIAAHYRRLRSA